MEKYNIPEQNSLDSMEGLDDFNNEPNTEDSKEIETSAEIQKFVDDLSWYLPKAFKKDCINNTPLENLIFILKKQRNNFDLEKEIEICEKIRISTAIEEIKKLEDYLNNNEQEPIVIQGIMSHKIYDLVAWKGVSESLTSLYNSMMNLFYEYSITVDNFERASFALEASGRIEESIKLKDEKSFEIENVPGGKSLTAEDIERTKDSWIELIRQIKEEGRKVFEDDTSFEKIQPKIDEVKKLLKSKFTLG